jgi:hypothetical protein
VRIPRTQQSRRETGFAKLILSVYPQRPAHAAITGRLLKCGAVIDEAQLWPTSEYPAVPLLLEYAGKNRKFLNDRNADDIHVLWRYDRATTSWREIARCLSKGTDWFAHIRPIAIAELARTKPPAGPDAHVLAAEVSSRVLRLLDDELDRLTLADRTVVMDLVYHQFAARAVEDLAINDAPPHVPLTRVELGYSM